MEEDKNLQLIRYENFKKGEIQCKYDWKFHHEDDGHIYTASLLYS